MHSSSDSESWPGIESDHEESACGDCGVPFLRRFKLAVERDRPSATSTSRPYVHLIRQAECGGEAAAATAAAAAGQYRLGASGHTRPMHNMVWGGPGFAERPSSRRAGAAQRPLPLRGFRGKFRLVLHNCPARKQHTAATAVPASFAVRITRSWGS
jgi:hypothetical protein